MAYGPDLTSGQTFDASGYSSSYTPDNAFDDSTATFWFKISPDDWEWIEVEFASAKTIARVRGCYNYTFGWDDGPDQVIIKASNTGAFTGEEVTLYTSATGLDWISGSFPAWKDWDFTNTTAYKFWRIYCSHHPEVGHDMRLDEIEMMEERDLEPEITEDAGIGDAVDGFSLTDTLADISGVGDQVDGSAEKDYGTADGSGFGDSVDGFNWTQWIQSNRELAVTRFYLTITGTNDLTTDIEIPMSSFQARKRTENPTYVSVVVPFTNEAAAALEARANGEIVIEMAYLVDGQESVREEILRADLEQINLQQGTSSRSIMLIGHKTITYANQETQLSSPTYKYTSDGRRGFRFASPDPYLNPGDTAIVGDEEFTVDSVLYLVSAGSGQTVMEVQE